jgi:hypothetical protein
MSDFKAELKVDRGRLWQPPYNELKFWVRVWDDALKRLKALRRFEQSPTLKVAVERYSDIFLADAEAALALREKAEKEIARLVSELPEWRDWAAHIPGVGAQLFGRLIGYIGNPAARVYASCLQKHCGVAPDPKTGKIVKAQKGQVRPYNTKAKSALYLIVTQTLKIYNRSPNLLAEIYASYKEKYKRERPDWTKGHCHYAAIIKAANIFVTLLWEVARKSQGLPAAEIYPIEHLGHCVKIPPEMLLHPRKALPQVMRAIREVERMLKDEEDQKVVAVMTDIVSRMKQHII